MATIYEGAAGESGTAVYTLFGGPAETGDYSGVLAQGTIDEAHLTGPLEGGTLGDLIALIKDGKAYVSVGTTANPVDAIRGQIAESSTGAETTVSTDESETTTTSADESGTTTTAQEEHHHQEDDDHLVAFEADWARSTWSRPMLSCRD